MQSRLSLRERECSIVAFRTAKGYSQFRKPFAVRKATMNHSAARQAWKSFRPSTYFFMGISVSVSSFCEFKFWCRNSELAG